MKKGEGGEWVDKKKNQGIGDWPRGAWFFTYGLCF